MATILEVGAGKNYATIQAALNDAADGDTIIIATGDYTTEGEIQINNALTVKAADGAEVIVDHVVLGSSFNDPNVSAVTISGLTIKPTVHNGGDWNYTGVWQNNTNISAITIENCVIDFTNTPADVKSVGIKLSRGSSGDAVETLEITGNTIIGTDNTQSYITVGDKGSISSVTVEGNECYGGSSSSAVTLDFGYKTTGEVSVVVKDNKVADVTNGHGINFGNVKNSDIDITVTGNTVENVTGEDRAAINMHNTSTEAGKVTVSDNVISDSISGINMSAVQGVVISDNTLTDCDESIIYTDGSVISGNTVDGEELTFPAYSGSDIFVYDKVTGEDGDKVIIDGIAYVVGENVFASMDDAVKALKDNNTTIAMLSDATMAADPGFKLNVISGDGNKHTLKVDSVIDVDAEFAKEINIDSALFMAYYNNHTIVVNGDLKGGFYNYTGSLTFNNSKITDSYDNSNIGGVVNINGDGSWTMENAQADNLKYINVGRNDWLGQGILNLNDTVVKAIGVSVDSSSAEAKSQINAVNSTIVTVLNDGIHGYLSIGANGELNLTDSNLIVAGALTNNGAVNVTGESTLNIGKFVGNDIVASGVLKDSNLTMEEFDWETGNVMVDGELEVQNGTFNNVQFRADDMKKRRLSRIT